IDSLSELRLLAHEPLRYRRQILGLKHYFANKDCTVLLLDDRTVQTNDLQPQSIAHGVIELDRMANEYGAERRRLRVAKLRGRMFRGGYHDFAIRTGGVVVFPRLNSQYHEEEFDQTPALSGMKEFDMLLGGGLDRGTSTLLTGPAGTGKSTLAMTLVDAACKRGEKAAVFAFEENQRIVLRRAKALSIDYASHIKSGLLTFRHVQPAQLSPGEFAALVREAVEQGGARVLVIDSLNGYLNAMPEEGFLTAQLHELLGYLNTQGVVTVMVLAQRGMMGAGMTAPVDVSYLADTVVMLRHFEAFGSVRKAISVLKKRTGNHEEMIRELRFTGGTIEVGKALSDFRGVLTGVPVYTGTEQNLRREGGQHGAG
ncbi:MAG TPA: ATPase domain-containing protein, partial [Phycisphaerales bacterium]|nr:ATPase domain-containing protein [Phycisphaerales bacterium]